MLVVLITAAVSLFAVVATHQLAMRRDSRNRMMSAATNFRDAIRVATVGIPLATEHWGSDIVAHLPAVCRGIETAVFEFKNLIPYRNRNRFLSVWQELNRHCNEEMPRALSPAEKLYGGAPSAAFSAKEKFHHKLEKLLSFAKST